MVLNWLREGGKYQRLMRAYYSPNRALVSREIHHIVAILCGYLREIAWRPNLLPHPFEGVIGAIDCTSHFRNRVHCRQADYYRGKASSPLGRQWVLFNSPYHLTTTWAKSGITHRKDSVQ